MLEDGSYRIALSKLRPALTIRRVRRHRPPARSFLVAFHLYRLSLRALVPFLMIATTPLCLFCVEWVVSWRVG